PSGLSPYGISLRGKNCPTTMAMMLTIIRRIRAIVVLTTTVAISWLGSIGVAYYDKYAPHVLPICSLSMRPARAVCRSWRHASDAASISCDGLLPEFHIRLLAEMLDIPFHQRGQLPRFANLDPVIHRPEEAVALRLKRTALGIDKLEDQHRRVV